MRLKAGKALIIFFLVTFGFTILSRIADSFTIPKVEVATKESTSLTFHFYGEGSVISESNYYVSIPEGIRVHQVYGNFGKIVKKGEPLFLLNREDIKKKLNTAKREEKKILIQLEQEKVEKMDKADSTLYENAKEAYENAKEDEKEAEQDYLLIKKKNRDEFLNSKKSEYEKQNRELELFNLESDSSMQELTYSMEEKKTELDKLNILDDDIFQFLQSYMIQKDLDKAEADKALEALYLLAYNNIEQYEEHKNEIIAAKKKLQRAEDTLISIRMQASLNNNESASSGVAYANSIREAENGVQDAKDELYKLNLKETKITAKAYEYVNYSRAGEEEKVKEIQIELYKIIYGETAYQDHKSLVEDKTKQYNRMKSAYENKKQQYEIKKEDNLNQLKKLKEECDSLENGTYDFKEALNTQEEIIKTTKRAVTTAKRAYNSAKRDYLNQKETAAEEEKKSMLRQESLNIDLQEKQENRIYLEELEQKKGIIRADRKGIINDFTIKAGNITTVNDIVSIGTGKLGIKGTFSKEDGEYLQIGDEIEVKLKGKNEKVICNLESILFKHDENKGEIAEVTGTLEMDLQTGFTAGSILNMEVVKNTDLYSICVPISALREEAGSTYVLKIREDKGILGKILCAEKIPVQVIEKNKSKAAVQGNITDEDKIISGSNKIISEGDRVRIK